LELTQPPILVAPDSFKGTFSAREVADAVASGVEDAGRAADRCPLADGGEGTMEALVAGVDGVEFRDVEVTAPMGNRVTARFALIGDTAIVETAQAIGLVLVPESDRNP
jgi:glycerate kinase